ncbi:hypothetical protein L6R46_04355 [Myxococcota bacterium]|nr:hypothetical protein [Myxococcota bacterium]
MSFLDKIRQLRGKELTGPKAEELAAEAAALEQSKQRSTSAQKSMKQAAGETAADLGYTVVKAATAATAGATRGYRGDAQIYGVDVPLWGGLGAKFVALGGKLARAKWAPMVEAVGEGALLEGIGANMRDLGAQMKQKYEEKEGKPPAPGAAAPAPAAAAPAVQGRLPASDPRMADPRFAQRVVSPPMAARPTPSGEKVRLKLRQ